MLTFLEEFRRRPLRRKFLYVLWCLLHLIFQLLKNSLRTLTTVGKKVTKRITSVFGCAGCQGQGHRQGHGHGQCQEISAAQEIARFAQSASKLQRLPKHIAFSVTPENSEGRSELDFRNRNRSLAADPYKIPMQTLARVISWAWATKIPLISLYDYHGEIKDSHHELGYLLQEELLQNYLAFKSEKSSSSLPPPPSPPTLKFHNVTNINGYSNGVNGIKNSNTLHIAVFSHEDGKEAIVEVLKEICNENLMRRKSTKEDINSEDLLEVNESLIESMLTSSQGLTGLPPGVSSEPEVLVIMGNILSTLDFLPWNIRLTEMFWTPKLQAIECEDFLDVLRKYSRCQQRHGT